LEHCGDDYVAIINSDLSIAFPALFSEFVMSYDEAKRNLFYIQSRQEVCRYMILLSSVIAASLALRSGASPKYDGPTTFRARKVVR
jgi:hypothetical protein